MEENILSITVFYSKFFPLPYIIKVVGGNNVDMNGEHTEVPKLFVLIKHFQGIHLLRRFIKLLSLVV